MDYLIYAALLRESRIVQIYHREIQDRHLNL